MNWKRFGMMLCLGLAGPLAGAATPVTTERLGKLLFQPGHSAPAILVARNSPQLASEISARVLEIAPQVGDPVQAGDVLIRLDCRMHQSQLATSRHELSALKAQQKFAASQLARARDLRRKRSISEETVDQRASELARLKAQVAGQEQRIRQARLLVERCEVRSPVNGFVAERMVALGDLAAPGTPLLMLVQTEQREVSARLREDTAARISADTEFEFRYLGQARRAELRRKLDMVDEATRSRELRLSLKANGLPTGAAGRLHWLDPGYHLPAEYLVRRNGNMGVFLLRDGKAKFHPLPNAQEGRSAAIDLPKDTKLITQGRERLQDGDAVELLKAK